MTTTSHLRAFFWLSVMTLFAGCASTGFNPGQAESPKAVLAAADAAGNSEATRRTLLQTAAAYQGDDRHQAARTLLQSKFFQPPGPELRDQYLLLAMATLVELQDMTWAGQLAQDLPIEQFSYYPQARQGEAARLQAETFRLATKTLDAVKTLMASADMRATAETDGDNDRIWQLLKQTDVDQLEAETGTAVGYEMQGWLELALSLGDPDESLQNQGELIRRWQNSWPDHPAAKELPSELQLVITLSQDPPARIALALPVSGPLGEAGKAVRDGFIAAFYADDSRDKNRDARIDVFDTEGRDFPELLEEIGQTAPELIVGPLRKSSLNSISELSELPAPLLALNYLDSDAKSRPHLYQFGLSAEDEARQIANRLVQDQRPQAVALIPWGDWGTRVAQSLEDQMARNNAPLLDMVRYDPEENLRATAAKLLDIDVSRQRAITVEQTIAQNIEFEPRRRQDIDAIVMVANPTVARQLKPLFAFYFGGNLPVYSPSTVYSGSPSATRDSDLEGVHFTDVPWILSEQNEFRQGAESALPRVTRQQGRLFAMGVDAYRLSSRLPLLREIRDSDVKGLTGVLTMSEDGIVQRQQLWAIFNGGTPELLPPSEMTEPAENQAGQPILMPGSKESQ